MLDACRNDHDASFDRVFDLAYGRLKQLAARRLCIHDAKATLSPTEWMPVAVVRASGANSQGQNRAHYSPQCCSTRA